MCVWPWKVSVRLCGSGPGGLGLSLRGGGGGDGKSEWEGRTGREPGGAGGAVRQGCMEAWNLCLWGRGLDDSWSPAVLRERRSPPCMQGLGQGLLQLGIVEGRGAC